MRSRYTAFVLGDLPYLLRSWAAETRPAELSLDPDARWLGLSIKQHLETAEDRAEVEFVARYRSGSRGATRLHERSRFLRRAGHWFYLDGIQY
jgi:SEC-C motif-containing protein